MELQRINVKLFTDAGGNIALDPFLDIFSRWREDSAHPRPVGRPGRLCTRSQGAGRHDDR